MIIRIIGIGIMMIRVCEFGEKGESFSSSSFTDFFLTLPPFPILLFPSLSTSCTFYSLTRSSFFTPKQGFSLFSFSNHVK